MLLPLLQPVESTLSKTSVISPLTHPPLSPNSVGLRVPCSSTNAFPSTDLTGKPPFRDLDGGDVFVASALVEGGKSVSFLSPSLTVHEISQGVPDTDGNVAGRVQVHPCKVTNGRCMISYGGGEHLHHVSLCAYSAAQLRRDLSASSSLSGDE
jgi:hypothetical protein